MEEIMETNKKKNEKKGDKINKQAKRKNLNVGMLVTVSMLAAIAVVLMLLQVPIWFIVPFYELDISELPALIGGFAFGPIAGVTIAFLKVLLFTLIKGSKTAFVGEIANFVMACAIVIPSALIYKKKKTKKLAGLGLVVGTITLVIVASVLNAYVLLPVYAKVLLPMEAIIEMGTTLNSSVTDISSFVFFMVVPFNLIKGILTSLVTLILYKKISPILKERASSLREK